jgi:tetratricopeptide (TPR) repeat protein
VKSILPAIAAGMLFLSLSACSSDMVTFSQDAKRAGMRQYNDGRYSEAAGSFQNAVRQDPTDAESEYWLGLSYEQGSSFHEAINAYKTGLSVMPPAWSARFNHELHDNMFDRLAKVVSQHDASNTETDLLVKTAADQKSAEQYRLLGRIFRYRGDADSAMEDYRRAVALEPANFPMQKELGLYLQQLTQNQEAGQVLRDAYRLNQDDEAVNLALRRLGMVPGPSLLADNQYAKPILPGGQLPDLTPTPAAHSVGPTDSGAPRD